MSGALSSVDAADAADRHKLLQTLSWRAPPVNASPVKPSLLHEQLMQLAALSEPDEEAFDERLNAACRIADLVRRAVGSSETQLFGSSSTGLSLPTSDLDVTVMLPCTAASIYFPVAHSSLTPLSLIHEKVEAEQIAQEQPEFIRNAKVPIVTFIERRSGLGVDISVNASDGLTSSGHARTALEEMPFARPIVLALKLALAQCALNKPRWGGIGSFLLFAMVTGESLPSPSQPSNLLIISFPSLRDGHSRAAHADAASGERAPRVA